MIRLNLETPSGYLTIQFLEWLSERPRTYGDVMDAWRTSCPRLSIWEDALSAGLRLPWPGKLPGQKRRADGARSNSSSWPFHNENSSGIAIPALDLRGMTTV